MKNPSTLAVWLDHGRILMLLTRSDRFTARKDAGTCCEAGVSLAFPHQYPLHVCTYASTEHARECIMAILYRCCTLSTQQRLIA